MKMIWREG